MERSLDVRNCAAVERFDGTFAPETIGVFAMKRTGRRPAVQVSLGNTDTLRLAVDEALALSAALIEVADEVEGRAMSNDGEL